MDRRKFLTRFGVASLATALLLKSLGGITSSPSGRSQWSSEQANAWLANSGWLVGCNYTPSTAINQLEMWQAGTFDPVTIDRELGWAQQLGFTSIRVFLQNLLWQQDAKAFLHRMDEFLDIAHKHHIKVAFVLFDSCWNPYPNLGTQPAPKPHVHNSGWVQSPGAEYLAHPARLDELKPYVLGVIGHFRNDQRIAFWDLYNEPDNMNAPAYIREEPTNKLTSALSLLKKAFAWAREANPNQPLTSGVWYGNWSDVSKLSPFEKVQLGESDIITFHNYGPLEQVRQCVQSLRHYNRPIVCTEYLARPMGSAFDPILGYFKQQGVGAFSWGFVSGKTQTIYPWDSWIKTYTNEPSLWFHDILHKDGTPYRLQEVRYIRSVTMGDAQGN